MSTKHLREMASGLHDWMGGHADACSDLMEQAAKQIDEMKAKIEQLSARVEVAEAGYQAAIQKAEWQARTNTELNALTLKMAKLVEQRDQLQTKCDNLDTQTAGLLTDVHELEHYRDILFHALTRARRELQACQAVIHLAGGFDPAYVTGAKAALKDADEAIEAVKGSM